MVGEVVTVLPAFDHLSELAQGRNKKQHLGSVHLKGCGNLRNAFGFGGYLVGVKLLGLEGGVYFGEMANYIQMEDILEGVYKSLSFGVIISWVSCYKGYYTGTWGPGAEGVSKATTQAVVLSSVFILIWDYFMTSMLF